MKNNGGFSVLEVMLAIGILAIIAVASTNLLFSSIGGSSKASVVAMIKQNGEHTISAIEKEARFADNATCPGGILLLNFKEGNVTRFDLDPSTQRIRIGKAPNPSAMFIYSFLTSERIQADSFTCTITPGDLGSDPDIVTVTITLNIPGTNTKDSFIETFQTRVSLRTY